MKITISNLKLPAIIGVYKHERKKRQTLKVNIELTLKSIRSTTSDKLADTIDYDALSKRLHKEAGRLSYELVEKFAAHMLKIILQDRKIKSARIEVTKARISKLFEDITITLEGKN